MNLARMRCLGRQIVIWGLVASMLGLLGCRKKKKQSSDESSNPSSDTIYILDQLPYDPHEVLYDYTGHALGRHPDACEIPQMGVFQGPIKVFTDYGFAVELYWNEMSDVPYSQSTLYYIYLLNDEGEWETRGVSYHHAYDGNVANQSVGLGEFNPNKWYTIRMVVATQGPSYCSDYNTHIIRFRTPAFPPDNPFQALIKVDGKYYSSLANTVKTPTLAVRYPYTGKAVRFYTDAACTEQIGPETTTKNGDYFELTLDNPLALGEHHFYVKATNTLDDVTPCSRVYATYTVLECPANYVSVDRDEILGTAAYCLMATEARQGDDDVAVPGYSDYPWLITPQEAKDACRRIAPNRDIITNLEWMAAAKQLEQFDGNWSGGSKSVDSTLNFGHTIYHLGVLNISDPNDDHDQLGDYTSFIYRRTFKLPTGTLWDFAGNALEWADNAEVGGETFQPITNTCGGTHELLDPEFSCPELDPRYYLPLNPLNQAVDAETRPYIHGNFRMGRIQGTNDYYLGSNTKMAAGRGGHEGDFYNTGIYSLFLYPRDYDTNGFRCVCHMP